LTFNSYSRENSVKQDYLYNDKEMQDELNIGWLDYGARMYQPDLGRFFTQDRFSEKYLDFSPYQYSANNPAVFIDINGDSVGVGGKQENVDRYLKVINDGLGGAYKASLSKAGNLVVSSTGKDGELTEEQQAFYEEVSGIAHTSEYNFKIGIVSGSSNVDIGDYDTHLVDIADVEQFNNANSSVDRSQPVGATQQGKVTHELVEQAGQAKRGYDAYKTDHAAAIQAENRVNGNTRMTSREGGYEARGLHLQVYREKNGQESSVYINTSGPVIRVQQLKPYGLPRKK
jgi:RHS repeat-associated protein